MTPPPPLVLLTGAVRGEKEGCVALGARALTFVPLHRGASGSLLSARLRAALSALGSAPPAPRWPLPVRSRSRPDLLAKLPRRGPSDPVPSRRAARITPRPTRAGRQRASPCAPALTPRPAARKLLHLCAPGAAGGNETRTCPSPGGGSREGRAGAGLQELFFQRQGCQPTARRRRLRPELGGRDACLKRLAFERLASAHLPLAFLEEEPGERVRTTEPCPRVCPSPSGIVPILLQPLWATAACTQEGV